MIEFEKAKIVRNEQTGGAQLINRLRVVAVVNEKIATALGVRWTLFDKNGVIRHGPTSIELDNIYEDAGFHLQIGAKAELSLEGVTAGKFKLFTQGDGKKKPKRMMVAFVLRHAGSAKGTSGLMLQEFLMSYITAEGKCRLKYAEQGELLGEKTTEIAPQMRTFKEGGYTAMIAVSEVPEGYAVIRKAASTRGSKLPQKPPDVSPSEQEALAIGAYDIRVWADKIVASAKSKAEQKHAAKLSEWAAGFAQVPLPPAPVTITKHAN